MNWTDQQQEAISARNRSIIVSAAAGSGKTAVLVERLLQILADPSPDTRVPAEKIIVVTFTKDAAAQMKHRLSRKISDTLEEMSRNGQYQEPAYDWLIQQRTALHNAKISTIHSFCFDFIRENADACGVSSQFSIAEPAKEYAFKKRALQSVLERYSREHRQEMHLLFNYFCVQTDAEIEKFILQTAEYLNSLAFPEYWMKQAKAFCQKGNLDFIRKIQQQVDQELQECIDLAEQSRVFAVDAFDKPGDKRYEEVLNADIAGFKAYQQYTRDAGAETFLNEPLKYHIQKFPKLPGISKKTKGYEDYYSEEDKLTFKQIRDLYKGKYNKLLNHLLMPLRFWKEDEKIQQQIIPLLLDLTEQYQNALFAEKQKQNVLCFDDAEHLVLKLLGSVDDDGKIHRSELARTLSENYPLIMIDEYQDSNNKQDCLFKLLSENCRISPDGKNLYYGTNVFLVGDVKQSIYRFRQANPENFRRAIHDSTMLKDCHAQEMARIYLNQNFRSASGILDFINALFRNVMSEKCGELVYDVHEQLNFGASLYQHLDPDAQGVQVLLPKSDPDIEMDDIQAECVADTIADMIASQIPVMLSDGTVRNCTCQDFCILMRSLKKWAKPLCEALRKRGIPFSCEDDDGFLTLPEIRFMINLLKVIDNPMTDMSMAAVLLSPVYGFTPEDLAMLKVSGTGRRIYLQMQSITEIENAVLFQKCTAFLHQLSEMRSLGDAMPLEKLIYEIYEMTDLLSLQSLWEHADQRRENLEIFAQHAKDYREHADLTAQSSLSGWLRYLDYISESDQKFTVNLTNQNADCVSIKTIHKSKGLEYPFIFLMHSERKYNIKPSPPPIFLSEDGMIGLKIIDRSRFLKFNSAVREYLEYQQDKQDKSEEMRLFYVALTRAKQKLFIVTEEITSETSIVKIGDFLEQASSALPLIVAESGSMQDWLLAYLLSSGEADYLRKAMDEDQNIDSSMLEYRVWRPSLQNLQSEQEEIIPAEPDKLLMQNIQKQFDYQYTSFLTELPAKRTVTSLAHPEKDHAEHAEIPDFMQEDEQGRMRKLRGAARGTAIHKIMQFMDFAAAEENLSQELERLQNADLLEPIEAESIQLNKIRQFFESDLYQRIAASEQVLKEKQLFVQIGELHLPENSLLLQNYQGTDGILIGTVDLLFRESDGWVIVDYKTDRVHEPGDLIEKYALQLGLYQKAMELLLDEPVKQALIYSFSLNQAINVNLSEILYE